ncbi:MAG: hypothetical protein LBQ03_00955 [Puniceicoccales bacterium]|jgi:hypothetical protein|nr:hypothetical protein [Puniceicoccales bacterium]
MNTKILKIGAVLLGLAITPNMQGTGLFSWVSSWVQSGLTLPRTKKILSNLSGLRVQDAPSYGEGLCGYSALLIALRAAEAEANGSVTITKDEVKDFLCNLQDSLDVYLETPMEMDHLELIGQLLTYKIIVEIEVSYDGTWQHETRTFNSDGTKTIRLYYSGSQHGGHYQAIIPNNIHVHY